jgi:E3 ubiquitin-protein ligase UBR4
MTKDRNSVLVLYDDGSLQVFSYTSTLPESVSELVGTDRQKQSASLEAERMKKLGVVLLGNRVNNGGATPLFPLDFFEKTTCITADVKLGGDILRNGDSEGVKLSLASDDGFLEGPSSSGFKVLWNYTTFRV